MSNTTESLLKRLVHLEKDIKLKFSNLDKDLHEISRSYFFNIYQYLAREIKNEAEIDLLTEYLVNTGQIDFREFMEFKKKNPLMKTYVDENKNALRMRNIFNSPECTPSKERKLFTYVNSSDLLIQKKRFEIKKQLLLERGYDKDSKKVIELDEFIMDCNNQIKNKFEKDSSFEEKEYYIKKLNAEEIYDGYFINNAEDIIERIREIPSLNEIHFEPSCKELYFESISNYWMGNFNASIVLLSVFLEAYLKEQYFFKTKNISVETLTPLINTCFNKNIINSEQKKFLSPFAETVRNNYIHARNHKIVTDVTIPMAQINLKSPSKPESIYGTSKQFPFLIDIAKIEKDKGDSKCLIIEIAKIVTEISKSYDELSEEDKELD